MPCRSDGYETIQKKDGLTINDLEAVVCGILSKLKDSDPEIISDKSVLNNLDYVEMGVSKDKVLKWWKNHQKEDAARKQAEKEAQRKNIIKKRALSKLTAEEKEILKLK